MSESQSQGKARGRGKEAGVLRSLFAVYSSWMTLVTNGALFAAYYVVSYEAIVRSNSGFFLLTIPYSLFVLLILASSILATVAIFYLRVSRRRRALSGVAQGPVSVALGALVVSCACSIPLLGPFLIFIGLNAVEVSGIISFIASYQGTLIEAIVLVDAAGIFYYLRLISRSSMARKV